MANQWPPPRRSQYSDLSSKRMNPSNVQGVQFETELKKASQEVGKMLDNNDGGSRFASDCKEKEIMNNKEEHNFREKLLINATVDDYIQSMRKIDGEGFSLEAIRDFFGSKDFYQTHDNDAFIYTHSKLQYVQKEYFTEHLGLKEVDRCAFGFFEKLPIKMMDIEYDRDKFFEGVGEGTIFYESEDGTRKAVVFITESRMAETTYIYNIYYNFDYKHIFQDWINLANNKNIYKGKKIDANCRFLNIEDCSWKDVILPESTNEIIKNNINMLFDNSYIMKKFNIPIKRGIILHGPPGTGKTQVCKAIAQETDASVLYALPADFHNQGSIRRITQMAKDLAPCILIIEDMDWVAQDRSNGAIAGFTMELMNQLDGLEHFGDIVTIGTTNSIEDLEKAIKNRPGRFDRVINIPNPGVEQIEKMMHLFLSNFQTKETSIESIAKDLEGLSGAHLRDLCQTASMFAVKDGSLSEDGEDLIITDKHFKEAWDEVSEKDYSSYQETQAKEIGNGFGFRSSHSGKGFLDTL